MNIIVIGCGKIGSTILESLANEGHDITVIDSNPEVIAEMTNLYDVMGVCGNGADCYTLEQAQVGSAKLVISTTSSDELNMLSCFLSRKLGAHHTIARIRNPEYNDRSLSFMKKELNLSMSINPEFMAAREIYDILKLPSAAKIDTFSVRGFEMIELKLKPDSLLDGMQISNMRSRFGNDFLICAVSRGDEAYIPDGNFVLKAGDRIEITAVRGQISKLLKEMGLLKKQAKKVMILGGSRTGYYLAKQLCASGNTVTVIEQNIDFCRELCELLPKATVIHGDGANKELLIEEGLESFDAFVALTGMDEENILVSSLAVNNNVPKVIAKINRNELIPLAEQWGLDCIVSPKRLISDSIVRYARALANSAESSVETLYKILDDKVEVLEFKVKSSFPKLSIPLKELRTKPNTLIAGIFRDRRIIIPSGDDVLLTDDNVIVLAANQRITALSDILK